MGPDGLDHGSPGQLPPRPQETPSSLRSRRVHAAIPTTPQGGRERRASHRRDHSRGPVAGGDSEAFTPTASPNCMICVAVRPCSDFDAPASDGACDGLPFDFTAASEERRVPRRNRCLSVGDSGAIIRSIDAFADASLDASKVVSPHPAARTNTSTIARLMSMSSRCGNPMKPRIRLSRSPVERKGGERGW